MQIDKSQNYRVLRAVALLQPGEAKNGGVTAAAVATHTGLTMRRSQIVCGKLSSMSNDRGNPWLYLTGVEPKQYRVSTGGELELDDANHDSRLVHDCDSWVDLVRWPWEQRYSDLQNVAVPTGSSRGGEMDPEYAAWKRNRAALADATANTEAYEAERQAAWRKLV